MSALRVAIISDLHADHRENPDTRVYVEPAVSRRGLHPIFDLEAFVTQEQLSADYLLLVGDTANRANAEGLQYGWRRANLIARQLGARLIATPGNHDVVTRESASDHAVMLKNLLPTFPTGNESMDAEFWRSGWCVVESDDHRILVLDSTADFPPYPTGATDGSQELSNYLSFVNQGGLRPEVEAELENYLAHAPRKLNVAMLHHHPLEHQLHTYMQDGYGPMRRGGELIELFTRFPSAGRWLVVHGHKHIPQLVSATTISTNGPFVLCAASVGAKIWDPVNTVTRNQFHLVEVRLDPADPNIGLAGSVMSYTWGFGNGWHQSEQTGSGLPGSAGFGNSIEPAVLATRIDAAVPSEAGAFIWYTDLLNTVPQLPYVMPGDWDLLEDEVNAHGIFFVRDRARAIVNVSRPEAKSGK